MNDPTTDATLVAPPTGDESVLKGSLLSIEHRKENGWTIAVIDGGHTVVGVMSQEPIVGSNLTARGAWKEHEKFGRQYVAASIELGPPENDHDLRQYLTRSVVGVGAKTAAKLMEKFGSDIRNALGDADRLATEANIRPALAAEIAASWVSLADERDAISFLTRIGIGPTLSRRVINHFTLKELTGAVTSNPYSLLNVSGVSFAMADAAALALNVPHDAPKRIRAGLAHSLQVRANDGHTMTSQARMVALCSQILALPTATVADHISEAAYDGIISERPGPIQKSILYCLPNLDAAERSIARDLVRLSEIDHPAVNVPSIAEIKAEFDFEPDPSQYAAICMALNEPVSVITGGPGTGKTTLLRIIVTLFRRIHDEDAVICSPTGRAAKRVQEATGEHAATVHRTLGTRSAEEGFGFVFDRDNPLTSTNCLHALDESSMVDVRLLASFLQAIPTGARVLIMGDPNQLPSIGPGNALEDLIAGGIPTTKLTQLHRTAEGSRIALTAQMILAGTAPQLDDQGEVRGVRGTSASAVVAVVREMLASGIALDDIGIVSPMRKGALGTEALNLALQEALNGQALAFRSLASGRSIVMPNGEKVQERFAIGDRVMQTSRNNYDLDIFNGDVFIVVDVPVVNNEKWLDLRRLDDNVHVRILKEHIGDIQLAYAWTVHKSQGSQYLHVIIALSRGHKKMLNRRLLNTAWTRAVKSNTIVGESAALLMACQDVGGIAVRETGLSLLIKRYLPERSLAA